MNPSYIRIRTPMSDAMARYAAFVGTPEIEPPTELDYGDSVRFACDGLDWRGMAVFVYENGEWTIFEDLSGHCGGRAAEAWLRFANSDDFVFAGYNDSIGYGELIVIRNRVIEREFLYDKESPEANADRGRLQEEGIEPIKSWIQVARFVDEDDLLLGERGLLWIHQPW